MTARRAPARKAPAKRTPSTKKAPTKKAPAAARPRKRAPATKKAAAPRRRRFRTRGQRLWDAHHDQVSGERGLVLLEEACRIADRLDQLDALLQGDADVWCRLVHDLRTQDYELRVDGALIEARQQANVLRQLVAALPLKEGGGDGDEDEAWLDAL